MGLRVHLSFEIQAMSFDEFKVVVVGSGFFGAVQNINRLPDLYRFTKERAMSYGQHSLISKRSRIRAMPEE